MSTATTTRSRALGTPMATALVIGNMIGSGVFLLPAALAAYGSISLVAWGFTAAGAFLLALVFARLGRAYPQTGGPYAYARRAFGNFIGFQTAWGYWIAAWAGNAAITVAGIGYLSEFWSPLKDNHFLAALTGIAVIWLLTIVNVMGVRRGGGVQLATTIAKLVPLVAIAVLGLFYVKSGNLHPFNAAGHSNLRAITGAATLTLWAFIGSSRRPFRLRTSTTPSAPSLARP